MLVDVCQWWAEIGLFCSSVYTNRRLYIHSGCLALFLAFKLYMLCWIFIFISTLILPFSIIVHMTYRQTFNPNSRFLHTFVEMCILIKLIIFTTFKSIKRMFSYTLYFPLMKWSRYIFLIYLTCYILQLQWLTLKHILLSTDIKINPGPGEGMFKFWAWNLNSLSAHDYFRVSLINSYNSVYNYDLIGIVETHLDSTADESKLALNGYSFLRSNYPQDLKRGGVGPYVKDTFPARNRLDLVTVHECIVCEIQLNRRKYFLIALYRSPSQTSSEFCIFMTNFETMLSKVSAEDPYAVIITGDLNCRSSKWWQGDTDNEEGKVFEPFSSDLGLHQLISEPTNIMGDSKSCIDLIFTDQPNLFLKFGVHPSPQEQCHHQIVYGELCITNPIPPPYRRRIWFTTELMLMLFKKVFRFSIGVNILAI